LHGSRGFMWFGTSEGLNRFDGYDVKAYRHNPADSTSISDNFIWFLNACMKIPSARFGLVPGLQD
jgi:hypothetical protein